MNEEISMSLGIVEKVSIALILSKIWSIKVKSSLEIILF